MMYYGMGAAVAVRVSNFNGQNDRVNVRRTAYSGFHIMLGIALIGALPIFLLRHQLGGWFSDSQAVSVTVAQLIIRSLSTNSVTDSKSTFPMHCEALQMSNR